MPGHWSVTPGVFAAMAFAAYGQNAPPPAIPEINTDRPDVTEASTVIPKGSLQLENGMTWTNDHGTQTLDLSESLLRIGLADRTELRVVVPNFLAGLARTGGATGFGDMALGMKQQLGPLAGDIDLSVIVALSLPTGANRISSHGYDPFVKFPWSKDVKAGWSVGGMQSLFLYTDASRRNPTYETTFYLEKQLTKRCDAFAEYVGDFARYGGSSQIGHFGSAYRVTETQQVDFHFGFGLSHAAPSRFFAVGYSVRVDKLWGR